MAPDTQTWIWKKRNFPPSFLFPAPLVTHHCVWINLTVQFCALMTGLPGSAEPQAAVCREGSATMRTFSTRGVKTIWDSHGPEKTRSVYRSASRLMVGFARANHLSAVITDGSSIKEFPHIILLGVVALRVSQRPSLKNQDGGFSHETNKDADFPTQKRIYSINAGLISAAMHGAWVLISMHMHI